LYRILHQPTIRVCAFPPLARNPSQLPVETWLSKEAYTWTPENRTPIASIEVEPDHVLPNDDCSNNEKKAQ
jgi:hypothetical protein